MNKIWFVEFKKVSELDEKMKRFLKKPWEDFFSDINKIATDQQKEMATVIFKI